MSMDEMEERVIMSSIYEDLIDATVQAINKGLSILYPTDTIWGLGCDVSNKSSVQYIRKIKQVPVDFPMVILVNSIEMIKQYALYIHPRIETLLLHHEQPLTILYDARPGQIDHLTSPEGQIAIRLCHDQFCNDIIYRIGAPLLATAASIYGQAIPTDFEEIDSRIKQEVDYIVSDRQRKSNQRLPSIMASFNHKGDLIFLRE